MRKNQSRNFQIMTPINENNIYLHPIKIIADIIKNYGDKFDLEFSYYVYKKNTIEDERRSFRISASNASNDQLISICNEAPPGTNLALHSNVFFYNGFVAHIPMIDMAARAVGVIGKVLNVLPVNLTENMQWFSSGRSFHGYGINLLTRDEWIEFMGRLLLANQPQQHPVVDPRWVGHRLIAGYSALRWTKNTEDYIQYPELIRDPHLISRSTKLVT